MWGGQSACRCRQLLVCPCSSARRLFAPAPCPPTLPPPTREQEGEVAVLVLGGHKHVLLAQRLHGGVLGGHLAVRGASGGGRGGGQARRGTSWRKLLLCSPALLACLPAPSPSPRCCAPPRTSTFTGSRKHARCSLATLLVMVALNSCVRRSCARGGGSGGQQVSTVLPSRSPISWPATRVIHLPAAAHSPALCITTGPEPVSPSPWG